MTSLVAAVFGVPTMSCSQAGSDGSKPPQVPRHERSRGDGEMDLFAIEVAPPRRSPVQRPLPDAKLEAPLRRIRGRSVIGSTSADGPAESTFHQAAKEILATATPESLAWLLADDDPAVRALGAWGHALEGRREPIIPLVCDRSYVQVCRRPGVCFGETLGQLVQQFLRAPSSFGRPTERTSFPLLSEGEILRLNLQLGAEDGCRVAWASPADRASTRPSSWLGLRDLSPRLPTWALAKALGRIEPIDVFALAEALDDPQATPETRLAAASALTLSSDPLAREIVEKHASMLEQARAGAAKTFLEVLERRRLFDERMEPVRRARSTHELEKLADRAIEAFEIEDALVLPEVLQARSFGARSDDVDDARADYLLWLADDLRQHQACWDSYRRVAYDLEYALERDGEALRWTLGSDFVAFEDTVRAQVRRLDEDKQCR